MANQPEIIFEFTKRIERMHGTLKGTKFTHVMRFRKLEDAISQAESEIGTNNIEFKELENGHYYGFGLSKSAINDGIEASTTYSITPELLF